MNDDLKKLYDAVSAKFDIGDYNSFVSKMSTTDDRKKFYDAVGKQGFDLGDYNQYEARLGEVKKKEPSPVSGVGLPQSGSGESELQSSEVQTNEPITQVGDEFLTQTEVKTGRKEPQNEYLRSKTTYNADENAALQTLAQQYKQIQNEPDTPITETITTPYGTTQVLTGNSAKVKKAKLDAVVKAQTDIVEGAKFRDPNYPYRYYYSENIGTSKESYSPVAFNREQLNEKLQQFLDENLSQRKDITEKGALVDSEFKGKKITDLSDDQYKVLVNEFNKKYIPAEAAKEYLAGQGVSFDINKSANAANSLLKGIGGVASGLTKGLDLTKVPEADALNVLYTQAKNHDITKAEYTKFVDYQKKSIEEGIKNGYYFPKAKLPGIEPIRETYDNKTGRLEYVYSEEQVRSWLKKMPDYDSIQKGVESPYLYEHGQMGQAAEAIDEFSRKYLKTNPLYEESLGLTKIPQLVGTLGAFAASGAINPLFAGAVGAASMKGDEYERAIQNGATPENALKASNMGAVAGSIYALPLSKYAGDLAKVLGVSEGNILGMLSANAAGGFTQQALVSLTSNESAKLLYDETRKATEGLTDASLTNAALAVLFHVVPTLQAAAKSKEAKATLKQAEDLLVERVKEEPTVEKNAETDTKSITTDEKLNPKIESAVIEINGKIYEGKNHAEAILKARADGQNISDVDRKGSGKFKLSDGTIIDRAEAMKRFGQDRSELLIPQDEAAKQADREYEKIKKPQNAELTGIEERNGTTETKNESVAEVDKTGSGETEQKISEPLNTEQDAIQIEKPNEGLLRKERPEMGLQEVGKGNTEQKIIAETQKEKIKEVVKNPRKKTKVIHDLHRDFTPTTDEEAALQYLSEGGKLRSKDLEIPLNKESGKRQKIELAANLWALDNKAMPIDKIAQTLATESYDSMAVESALRTLISEGSKGVKERIDIYNKGLESEYTPKMLEEQAAYEKGAIEESLIDEALLQKYKDIPQDELIDIHNLAQDIVEGMTEQEINAVTDKKQIYDKAAKIERGVSNTSGQEVKTNTKAEKLNASLNELKSAWDDFKNSGVVFDPRSQAEKHVRLTKALIKVVADGAVKTADDLIQFVKGHLGFELDKEHADYIISKAPNASSVKNEFTERKRIELGVGEGEKKSVRSVSEVKKLADEAVEKGFNIKGLIDDILNKGDEANDVEIELISRYIAGTEAKLRTATGAELDRLVQDMKDAYNATTVTGRETARALAYRKQVKLEDESLANQFIEETEAFGVGKLTDAQKEKIITEHDELQKLNKELEEKIKKLEDEGNKLKAQENIKKEAAKVSIKKKHEDYVKERVEIFSSIKDKLKKARSEASATAVPYAKELIAIAPDVAKLVKNLVADGVTELATITKYIHDELKDSIHGVTEKDVQDVIAGKYNVKKTKPELASELNQLKKEAKLANELEALMRGEKTEKSEKKKIQDNQRIEELKKEIRGLRSSDEAKVEAWKEGAKKRIAHLEKQIAEGNYETPKREPLKLDKEALALQDKIIHLKVERRNRRARAEFERRSKKQKALDKVTETLNVFRTLMTTIDFSAVLRQGIVATVAHPKLAFNPFKNRSTGERGSFFGMFSDAVSEKSFQRWLDDLRSSEYYPIMEQSKLHISDPNNPKLNLKEEQFMTNLIEKIPYLGTAARIPGTNRKIGGIIRGSERAYIGYLNRLRASVFLEGASVLERQGMTFSTHPEVYKALADFVNNSTGRGKLGGLEGSAQTLNTFVFAPRLITSRLNLLNPLYYKSLPKPVRKMALADFAKFVTFGASILAIGNASGLWDTDTDPRSTDFGKMRNGNTRLDIFGGFAQYVRMYANLYSAVANGNENGESKKVARFGRGKLAPVPSMINDLIQGENIVGEPVTLEDQESMKKEIFNHIAPLIYQDVHEAIQDKGMKALFTVGLPSMFGVGVQTYGDSSTSSGAPKPPKPPSPPKAPK